MIILAIATGLICLLHGIGIIKVKEYENLTEKEIRKKKRNFIIGSIFFLLWAIAKFLINKGYL